MSWTLLFVVVYTTTAPDYARIDHIPTQVECEKVRTFLAANMPNYRSGMCVQTTKTR